MRLIDADALKAIRFHDLPYSQIVPADCDTDEKVSAYKLGWNDAIDAIVESVPAVDHIKHGHWIEHEVGLICSECGHYTEAMYDESFNNEFGRGWALKRPYYCGYCGAKMDEVEDGKID